MYAHKRKHECSLPAPTAVYPLLFTDTQVMDTFHTCKIERHGEHKGRFSPYICSVMRDYNFFRTGVFFPPNYVKVHGTAWVLLK